MDTSGQIIFAIILLHLLAGFGYIMYRITPKKESKEDTNSKG